MRPLLRIALLGMAALALAGGLQACHRRQVQPSEVGGPFHMVDQNGAPRDEGMLKGKWTVIFFGYTFCPDVCPTTLTALGQAMDQLGPRASAVRVVFVTVDPDRDTPAKLKAYLSSPVFPKNVIGLTGTPAQVAGIARAYHIFYQKEGTGADYSMDHSAILYLMTPDGQFDHAIPTGVTPEEMARQIREAISGA
ncbi:MAG: SCO family protein [Caulobacterales bacterium]